MTVHRKHQREPRQCQRDGIDCGGQGFHRLVARESSTTRGREPDGVWQKVRTFAVTFRAPCICAVGAAWAVLRARGGGAPP